MNRKIKNIIMITCSIILIVSMTVTGYIASNDMNTTSTNWAPQEFKTKDGNAPDGERGAPPNMRERGNRGNRQTPPDMPNSDNNSNDNNSNDNNSNDNNSDNNKNDNTANQTSNEMKNNITKTTNTSNTYSIKTHYYLIFGLESMCFVLIVVYLIMSNMNKKTLKETFKNFDKVLIYIMSSIIFTFVLSTLLVFGTRFYHEEFVKTDTNTTIKTNNTTQKSDNSI